MEPDFEQHGKKTGAEIAAYFAARAEQVFDVNFEPDELLHDEPPPTPKRLLPTSVTIWYVLR